MSVRRKLIRRTVERLLRESAVKQVPVPVEKIARSLGVRVERAGAEDDLSGFIFRDRASDKVVIGINANHHRNRQTFTMAHELGHYLLHDGEGVHVDRRFTVRLRNRASSEGTNAEEKEANLFAAELLMPATLLERDLSRIDVVDLHDESIIADLAERYGVSSQAMMFRLAYLGYVQL